MGETVAGRPCVGVSACLLGERVRYDGADKHRPELAEKLAAAFEVVAVCPEVEFGLGVPRAPIELQQLGRTVHLIEPSSGRDLTSAVDGWAAGRVAELVAAGLDGFVLKARSPSCGPADVPIHHPGGGFEPAGRGRFARALAAADEALPLAHDEELAHPGGWALFAERVHAHHAARGDAAR